MKKTLALIFAVMMFALLPMASFAEGEIKGPDSTITYRLSDEMYQAGVRFYGTDAQEKTTVVTSGEPFSVTGFVALKYQNQKLGGVDWKSLTEVRGYKVKNQEKIETVIEKNQAVSKLDAGNTDKSLIYDVRFEPGTQLVFEASAGIFGKDVTIQTVVPKKMSIRLEDGTILKDGDSFTMKEGGTVRFQMCTNNWDTDTYTDDGQGLAGTKVYSYTHVKGTDDTLRVDTNTYFMAYRFHFAKGDYNKQTGIKNVLSTPLESLSVNLPLGSLVSVTAYQNETKELASADVFIETAEDKTLSYTDYYWEF